MQAAMGAPPEDFRTRFHRLRPARSDDPSKKVAIEDLYWVAKSNWPHDDIQPVSLSSVQKALAPGSRLKSLTIDLLATIAAAIQVDPIEFPEYRLALARASLDEVAVGTDRALRNLKAYEAAGPSPAEIRAACRAEREAMRFAEEDAERQRKKRKKSGA